MKIEIRKNNKIIKSKKIKLKKPNLIDIDFSSIKSLVGNKIMLEQMFQQTKKEYNNG